MARQLVSDVALRYIRMAFLENIKAQCPGYSQRTIDDVWDACLNTTKISGLGFKKETLIRAIELAAEHAETDEEADLWDQAYNEVMESDQGDKQ